MGTPTIVEHLHGKAYGWTGNPCPTCTGRGAVVGIHHDERCPACGGTGDEYGEISPLPPGRDKIDAD